MVPRHTGLLLAVLAVAFVALAIVASREGGLPGDATGIRLAQQAPFRAVARFFERPVDEYLLPAAAIGGAALSLYWRRLDLALVFVLSWATLPLNTLAKEAVERPRPAGDFDILSTPESWGYPSGHSYLAATVALAWTFAAGEVRDARLRAVIVDIAMVVALLAGFSRVWLGVHWPTDVIGGWLLAAIVMVIARGLAAAFATRTARRGLWLSH